MSIAVRFLVFLLLPASVVMAQGAGAGRPASAAAAPALLPSDLMAPIHAHGDDPQHGVWAGAAGYKASFHDGFVFYPCLGERYPTNLPLRWRTASVTAAGEPLALSSKPGTRHGDWRWEYLHPGVHEVYDVRPDGVEQSFVIERKPLSRGDLVVRGEITTALHADLASAAHQELRFVDGAGVEVVRYGRAFAVDAAGARAPVTTAYDGRQVTLTVDGAWLEGALFPVTVDPLTSAQVVSASLPGTVASCDVGAEGESTGHNLMFAVDRAFSATDHDVYAYLSDVDFAHRVLIMSDIDALFDDRNVTVAFVAGADTWLMGFQREYSLGGNPSSTVRVHFHPKGNTQFNVGQAHSYVQIVPEFLRNPDLGGTAAGSQNVHGMLVFTSDPDRNNGAGTTVWAMPIQAQNQQFLTAYNFGYTGDNDSPSVNQVSGGGDGWVLVWSEWHPLISPAREIWVVRTDPQGQRLPNLVRLGVLGGRDLLQPQVTGLSGEYLVSYAATPSLAIGVASEIKTKPFAWHLPALNPTPRLEQTIASVVAPTTWVTNSGIAMNHALGTTAVLTYNRTFLLTSGTTSAAFAVRTGDAGAVVDSNTVFNTINQSATPPAVCYAEGANRFPLVYGTNESTSNFLYGVDYDYPADAGDLPYGTGCGAATISAVGPYIGNAHFAIDVDAAPPGTATILLLAARSAAIPLNGAGMPGCVLNLDPAALVLTLAGTTNGSGHGSIPLPLPEFPPVPLDFFSQYFYLSPGANAAGLQATQGLRSQVR